MGFIRYARAGFKDAHKQASSVDGRGENGDILELTDPAPDLGGGPKGPGPRSPTTTGPPTKHGQGARTPKL